jgi:hypothetical protein
VTKKAQCRALSDDVINLERQTNPSSSRETIVDEPDHSLLLSALASDVSDNETVTSVPCVVNCFFLVLFLITSPEKRSSKKETTGESFKPNVSRKLASAPGKQNVS